MTEHSSAANAALSNINSARFSRPHRRTVLVTGVGFFTDAYQLFIVSFACVMFGYVYYPDSPSSGKIPPSAESAIKLASSVGAVVGQIGFGIFSDLLGRNRMYGVELGIMIIATMGLTLSGNGPGINVIGPTIYWRIILGIGVGGDYPSSSVISSEFASKEWRGAMMALVFSSQGFGQFTAALVFLICTAGARSSLLLPNCNDLDCQSVLDKSWRILYGFGIIPAVFALYFRLTIPETIHYTLDVRGDENRALADSNWFISGRLGSAPPNPEGAPFLAVDVWAQASIDNLRREFRGFCRYFGRWDRGQELFGTAASWFFLDVAFYGIGLNTPSILQAIGFVKMEGPIGHQLLKLGWSSLVLSVAGFIPGYFAAMATIDRLGRKPLQIGGFVILTILFCIIGFAWDALGPNGRFAMFCLCCFFSNFGPNTTTFIVPAEHFRTRYRATAHGISAAAGKIGSIISQVIYNRLKDRGGEDAWVKHIMQIYAVFMLLGVFSSLFIPETKGKALEVSERPAPQRNEHSEIQGEELIDNSHIGTNEPVHQNTGNGTV